MDARALRHDADLTTAVVDALRAADLAERGHAFVVDLQTMTFGAHRADEDVYAASVVKIAIMVEAFRRFADGSLDPDGIVAIDARNVTPTSEPTHLRAATTATLLDLVALMIEKSDNIATNQLIDLLDRERVTTSMRAFGIDDFLLGRKLSGAEPYVEPLETTQRNRFTPQMAGVLLSLIAEDLVPRAAEQRAILERCVDDEKLARGLAAGDRFAHKTGETSQVNHDAGIVTAPDGRRYIIVLYTTLDGERFPARMTSNAKMAKWAAFVRGRLS